MAGKVRAAFRRRRARRGQGRWILNRELWKQISVGGLGTLFFGEGVADISDASPPYVTWGVVVVCYSVVARSFLTRSAHADATSRAWARLDTPTGSGWVFQVNAKGEVIASEDLDSPPVSDRKGTSLAISPDGSIVGALKDQTLRIFEFDRRHGRLDVWRSPITIGHKNAKLLAIAPKGAREVWSAFSSRETVRLTFVSKSAGPTADWRRVADDDIGDYAAFLGARLLVLQDQTVLEVRASGTQPWAPTVDLALPSRTISALDVAEVGGERYVALLEQFGTNDEPSSRLLVVPTSDPHEYKATELGSVFDHVGIVRLRDSRPDSLSVLVARGNDIRRCLPFRDGSVTPLDLNGRKRLVMPWRRERRPKSESKAAETSA